MVNINFSVFVMFPQTTLLLETSAGFNAVDELNQLHRRRSTSSPRLEDKKVPGSQSAQFERHRDRWMCNLYIEVAQDGE